MTYFDNSELRKRVDEVLYYIWDPIGVSSVAEARGEYVGYVSEILELLEKHKGIKEISSRLEHIRTSNMGLSGNKKSSDLTAQILQDHKRAIELGLA